jgi:hypothetical protein
MKVTVSPRVSHGWLLSDRCWMEATEHTPFALPPADRWRSLARAVWPRCTTRRCNTSYLSARWAIVGCLYRLGACSLSAPASPPLHGTFRIQPLPCAQPNADSAALTFAAVRMLRRKYSCRRCCPFAFRAAAAAAAAVAAAVAVAATAVVAAAAGTASVGSVMLESSGLSGTKDISSGIMTCKTRCGPGSKGHWQNDIPAATGRGCSLTLSRSLQSDDTDLNRL